MPLITLIFSRDRAMQLDAVLRSFFLRCLDGELEQVYVLYRTSTEQHARQYAALQETYPTVNFVTQGEFRRDVLRIANPYGGGSLAERRYTALNELISNLISLERFPLRYWQSALYRLRTKILGHLFPTPPEDSHILFLVDDNLFVRDFSLRESAQLLRGHPRALGFSLRLGENTAYCYAMDHAQALPEFASLGAGVLKFDWTTSELDFAYPLEISSSVYRLKDIFPVIVRQPFSNPNELEYQLAVSAAQYSQRMPFLLCPEKSLTFCNPLNLVQNFAPNRASDAMEYSSEHLADLFDQGYRVQIEAFRGFVPQSCHQEVALEFYKPEGQI